jgi:hypothetical protein
VRRGTAAAVCLVLTLALPPVAGARAQRGFVELRTAAEGMAPLPTISPPPRLHGPMRWYRWHPSTRSLLARAPEFGSAAVIGLGSMDDLAPLRRRYGFARVEPLPGLHAAEVSVDRGQLAALLATAAREPRIRYVQPLGPSRRLLRLRNDPMLRLVNPAIDAPYEWEFSHARIDGALNLSLGSPSIVVGVVDSGVGDVPDLTGKVDGRWYFTGQVSGGDDIVGHGTAVASLIAANTDDGFGMAGFGGATHVVSFRDDVLDDTTVAIAVDKLVSLGVRIVNLSLGGSAPTAPVLRDSLRKAELEGVLIVASAGNGAAQSVDYPAFDLQPPGGGQSYGLAVGASNFDGTPASFSNQGTHLSLLAPGSYLDSCTGVLAALSPVASAFDHTCVPEFASDGGARYGYVAGTSFSAPEVAGAAALLWAAAPLLKNFEVADIVKRSAHRGAGEGWNTTVGWGTLDAAAALEDGTGRSSADVLGISGFGLVRPGVVDGRVTATGRVAWADGAAPDSATVTCSASVGGAPLQAAEQSLAGGAITCSWDVPAGDENRSLTAGVTVADGPTGVTAASSFTALLGDLTPPVARARRAAGGGGRRVALPFTGSEETGEAAATIVVERNARRIARIRGPFFSIRPGRVYSLRWQAPKTRSGRYAFCVTLADRGGNVSRPSCGPISLR